MGRFDRKYPQEALQRLFDLAIVQERPTAEAVRTVKAETGIEIRLQTAWAYVRDERRRIESKKARELSFEIPTAADQLTKRLLNLLDQKTQIQERKGPKADLDEVRKIGSIALELKRLGVIGQPVTNGNGARKGATGKTANEKTREMLAKLGESNGTE